MFFDLLLKYLPLFQVGAVIVASGILSVAIARELYDVEQVTLVPPGAPAPTSFTRYKYRTIHAQVARDDFHLLSDVIYVIVFTLLMTVFAALLVEGGLQLIEGWGATDKGRQESCGFGQGFYRFMFCQLAPLARDASEAARGGQHKLAFPVGVLLFWIMVFSAVVIFGFAVTVRRVVRIRAS